MLSQSKYHNKGSYLRIVTLCVFKLRFALKVLSHDLQGNSLSPSCKQKLPMLVTSKTKFFIIIDNLKEIIHFCVNL